MSFYCSVECHTFCCSSECRTFKCSTERRTSFFEAVPNVVLFIVMLTFNMPSVVMPSVLLQRQGLFYKSFHLVNPQSALS